MKNRIFKDYGMINLNTLEGRQQFIGAINAYAAKPAEVQDKLIKAGTTQFTATSDFADEIRQLIETYHLGLGEIDVAWKMFFSERDFSSVPVPGFKIRDVSSGLTFSQRPEGGRARVYRVVGTEVFVSFDTYGGGLEFDQAWAQDQQWWLIEDTVAEFVSKWYRDKATTFYTLIGALDAGYNVAYDATGANVLEKDIITLNTAAAALLTALATAGYAVTANTPVVVLSPIQLKGRLNRALAAVYNIPGTASANMQVEYNITTVYSLNVLNAGSACTDKWYMGVPGMKNKIGEKMPLTVYSDFNSVAFANTTVGWGRYGSYMYEPQFRRLATA
jgi:hypothetical protein